MSYIKTTFSLKDEDLIRIRDGIKRCGVSSEEVLNNYLHNEASERLIKQMNYYIPVAKPDKTHKRIPIKAKGNKWYEQENYNLAVTIENSLKGKRGTSYYYLYYVATGTGSNKYVGERNFLEKGLNDEYNNIVDGMLKVLDENIQKELN